MSLKEILDTNTDDIIAITVILPTIGVLSYQSIVGAEITMITEPLMLILGYFFGRKITK